MLVLPKGTLVAGLFAGALLLSPAQAQTVCDDGLTESDTEWPEDVAEADCSDELSQEKSNSQPVFQSPMDRRALELLTDGKGLHPTPQPDLTPVNAEAQSEAEAVRRQEVSEHRQQLAYGRWLPWLGVAAMLFITVLTLTAFLSRRRVIDPPNLS